MKPNQEEIVDGETLPGPRKLPALPGHQSGEEGEQSGEVGGGGWRWGEMGGVGGSVGEEGGGDNDYLLDTAGDLLNIITKNISCRMYR